MITKINIQGYKSINNQEVKLNPINVLIGGNGVGKSNFISIFTFLKNIYNGNLEEYVIKKGGANNFLYFGTKTTQEICFDICFGSKSDSYSNRFIIDLGNKQDSLYIKSVQTAYKSGDWYYRDWEKNVEESNFRNINRNQAFWVNQYLQEFEVYHFHDTGDNSPIKGPSNINDNRNLRKNGSNIASFLYLLKEKHPKHFLRIETTIKSIAPFFDRFNLEPSELNPESIRLEWQEKGNSENYFDSYNLSDGTIRFICLATLLMQPNPPKTIIIDEPELGLHPVAINKLASLIRKISKTTQVIVSTQSINLLDNFNPEDIIIADRENNKTVFKRLETGSLKDWIEDYSLGDIWGKNIFGGQPF